jgi:hypothetical protein
MPADLPRWVFAAVLILLILGLLLWARGPEHHRGQNEGALAAVSQGVAR